MLLEDFNFSLPKELIAQKPAEPRDSARLLVYTRATDTISHHTVRDLPGLLPAGTLCIANNSRVRKARLHATVETPGSTKQIEVLVLRVPSPNQAEVLIGGKGIKPGHLLRFSHADGQPSSYTALIRDRLSHPGMNTFLLQTDSVAVEELCEQLGSTPLPPYIEGKENPDDRYQTVFSGQTGSAAAPTAGLHFTNDLITQLQDQGHDWQEITLHVGLGTFLPLREPEIIKNRLHTEQTEISSETARHINLAKQVGRPVLGIGTTSCRTLESHSIPPHGLVQAGRQETELFMYPGYAFRTVSHLFTNFHLPKSSLLLLVSAFLGNTPAGEVVLNEKEMVARLHHIYDTALRNHYRFFSYGDAMLIL